MNEKREAFAWLKRPSTLWIVLIAGLAGILLIGLSEWLPKSESVAADTDIAAYTDRLEQQLTALCSKIGGVGDCRVMVTLESGVEYIYAAHENTASAFSEESGETVKKSGNESREDTVVLADGGGLVVTARQPAVRGVAVVCEGGSRPEVQQAVGLAVATALNISTRRVCVIGSA